MADGLTFRIRVHVRWYIRPLIWTAKRTLSILSWALRHDGIEVE